MVGITFSTDHLDYLQRNSLRPGAVPTGVRMTSASPILRRLWHVRGVGQMEKTLLPNRNAQDGIRLGSKNQSAFASIGQARLQTEDILIGLSGFHIPLALVIRGAMDGVTIQLGTWSQQESERAPPAVLNSRQQMLGTVIRSLYPAIDLWPAEDVQVPHHPLGGFVLGIPTAKPPDPLDGALPIDRLSRAMYGSKWLVLVLAEPISGNAISGLRSNVINEMRSVQAAAEATRAPSPLAKHYEELLDLLMMSLSRSLAVGAWRTGVYLLGDESSYYRLASVWRSIFSGEASLPEPVRVWESHDCVDMAQNWAMPDTGSPPGPGVYQHPFAYQTLLNSTQLAAYIHLPSIETCGFSVQLVPDYDVVPKPAKLGESISLGKVVDRARDTNSDYSVARSDLNRHGLIAGVTGSGKTNTLFHILIQLWKLKVPFLVLEPAKTEYRSLLTEQDLAGDLRIFTLGDENISPLRVNPFEVGPGVLVATHIDLLKSVFNASFGMWNPLPQVLERCLHAVYRDYGWDPVRGINYRLGSGCCEDAFPTLTDLHNKVEEVADSLGYEERVTSDIKAGLMTRLNSLRIGGKGIMLDTQRSIPTVELLERPTIVELESIGDDDEKAFVMGLLLIRIYEHLRATGSVEGAGLKHVIVVEEAHRLLANVPPSTNQEQSNVRGKAVETFANMLSEIRAYGEGFLIAEQIPSKLAPDVIKNTNLKIVHRMVAGDDRQVLGETMNMAEQQCKMLATLRTGQAAVFAEGDDRPILITVPYAKIVVSPEMQTKAGSDRIIMQHMTEFRQQPALAERYVPFARCPQACGEPFRYCEESRVVVGQRGFQDLFAAAVLALVIPRGAVEETGMQVLAYLHAYQPANAVSGGAIACVTMHAARWYFASFGRRYNWTYDTVKQLRALLISILIKMLPPRAQPEGRLGDAGSELADFYNQYRAACRRSHDPFPTCIEICPDGNCLFRYHAELLLADSRLSEVFFSGMAEAVQGTWNDLSAIYQVAVRLTGMGAAVEVRRSAGLCYGVQQITYKKGMLERARWMAIGRLMEDYDARALTQPGGRNDESR